LSLGLRALPRVHAQHQVVERTFAKIGVLVAGAIAEKERAYESVDVPKGTKFRNAMLRIPGVCRAENVPCINLMELFDKSIPKACSTMSLIYLVGMVIIWLAPETKGKPLPS
jgi:hypothetical protein